MSRVIPGAKRENVAPGAGSGRGLRPVGEILFQLLAQEAAAGDLAAQRMLQACPRAGAAGKEADPQGEG